MLKNYIPVKGDNVKISSRNKGNAYSGMEGVVTDVWDDGDAFFLRCETSGIVISRRSTKTILIVNGVYMKYKNFFMNRTLKANLKNAIIFTLISAIIMYIGSSFYCGDFDFKNWSQQVQHNTGAWIIAIFFISFVSSGGYNYFKIT